MVLAVAVDETNTIWAGTRSGGLNRIEAGVVTSFGTSSGLPEQPITAILTQPARGSGREAPGVSGGAGQTPSPQPSASSLEPLPHVLWLGYGNGTVVRGEDGHFQTVIEPGVFNNQAIRALHEDSIGRIWIGTAGGQLACIVTGRYLKWDLNLDPADSAILGILSDDDGDLWVGTGRAIYHVAATDVHAALAGSVPVHCQPVYEADRFPVWRPSTAGPAQ